MNQKTEEVLISLCLFAQDIHDIGTLKAILRPEVMETFKDKLKRSISDGSDYIGCFKFWNEDLVFVGMSMPQTMQKQNVTSL